jgi:pilus assembly protein FimV
VVKSARLFYEDGAMPRAVELLQFAIEDRPAELRPWLALFEIYRLERLTGEYAELARRFYEHHGDSDAWRKVRYFGREIDPGNFLYREDVDALETITPTSTPRHPPGERFDPVQENWLDAPMGFDNQVLANELRQALMGAAGVVDQDLVPNPMPALRDAEMFTVA